MDKIRALGVDPGLQQTTLVLGNDRQVNHLRLIMTEHLIRAESIAEQILDYILLLYSQHASTTESINEIHLATRIDELPDSSLATEDATMQASKTEVYSDRTADNHETLRRATDILFERLQQFMADNNLSLKLHCHDNQAILSQKKQLSLNKPLTEFSLNNEVDTDSASTLWSFAFKNYTGQINPSARKHKPVEYEFLSGQFLNQQLPLYKQQVSEKFHNITFPNTDIENERQILLNLADDIHSSKLELLSYQERISRMLEKHMRSIATTTKNPQHDVFAGLKTPEHLDTSATQHAVKEPDVGLFDIEVMDNANRIWTEFTQIDSTQRVHPPTNMSTANTAESTGQTTPRVADRVQDIQLDSKAVITRLRPQGKRRRSSNGAEGVALKQKIKPDKSGLKQRERRDSIVGKTNNSDRSRSNTKDNDFFSAPAFVQDPKQVPETPLKTKRIKRRRRKRKSRIASVLPILGVMTVAGVYFFLTR